MIPELRDLYDLNAVATWYRDNYTAALEWLKTGKLPDHAISPPRENTLEIIQSINSMIAHNKRNFDEFTIECTDQD